jgi:predicted transcriptional regulator
MPYQAFADAAQALRHDLEALALAFGVSLEQVCHRLSNLQRPGRAGTPVYFLRIDAAGNITKRHSANRLRFPRFGGACPVWSIHDACAAPDRWLIEVIETPDQARYLSIARGVLKPSGSFREAGRRYALGVGCEIAHAHRFVYADGLNLQARPAPIGPSCRVCERDVCPQRAFPPVDRQLLIDPNERRVTPFGLR